MSACVGETDVGKLILASKQSPYGEAAAGEKRAKTDIPDHARNPFRFAIPAKAVAAGEPYVHASFGHMRDFAKSPLPCFPCAPIRFAFPPPGCPPSREANDQSLRLLRLPPYSSTTL